MKMKKLMLNAMVSLVVAIGVLFAYDQFFTKEASNGTKVTQPNYNQSTPARLANYNAVKSGKVMPVDFTHAAQLSTPAVVHVKKTYSVSQTSSGAWGDLFDYFNVPKGQQSASGSGVILSSDGYIVTNNHVVKDADELKVTLHDNRTLDAEIVGTDPSTDIALLKVDEGNLPAVPFSNSDSVNVGEWVLAVGNPFDLTSTVTAGIVSAKGRNINILRRQSNAPIESFIQTDAAVNPGNSGGALVNLDGELVGINTAIASSTGTYAGYSFAVPSNIVQKVVTDLKEYGVVQRAFLGVRITDVNSELKKSEDLESSTGVYIASVNSGSAAEDAGLQEGDVITGVDDEQVTNVAELQEKISLKRPGDKVQVIYMRDGSEYVTDVTLKNKMNTTSILTKEDVNAASLLGAKMETLESEKAHEFRRKGGVKITELGEGPLSEYTNIEKGFIITKVNDKPVTNVEEVQKILSAVDDRGAIMIEGFYPESPARSYMYAFRK